MKLLPVKLLFLGFSFLSGYKESKQIIRDTRKKEVKSKDDYKLVWSDEFNNEGLPDSLNWTYERGFVRNQELQWYQPENAKCARQIDFKKFNGYQVYTAWFNLKITRLIKN